jgi:hypothetical protein
VADRCARALASSRLVPGPMGRHGAVRRTAHPAQTRPRASLGASLIIKFSRACSACARDLEQSLGRARKRIADAPWRNQARSGSVSSLLADLGHRLPVLTSTRTRWARGTRKSGGLDTTEVHPRRIAVRSGAPSPRSVSSPQAGRRADGRTRRKRYTAAKSTGPDWFADEGQAGDYQVITAGAVAS